MLEIARICCRIERSLRRMHHTRQEKRLECAWKQFVRSSSPANIDKDEDGCFRMCVVALLQLQLACSRDQRRHCDQRQRTTRPVHLRCEWCTAAGHETLWTTRPNIDVRRRRRAHVQSTGAAEPRRAKIFAFVTVQVVSFLASGATLRGC